MEGKFRRLRIFELITIPFLLHKTLSAFKRKGMQKEHDKHSLKAVCHALPRGSSFSPIYGGYRLLSGLLYCHQAACPAVELCTNIIIFIIQFQWAKVIPMYLEHLGHLIKIWLSRTLWVFSTAPTAVTLVTDALSNSLPCLHAGQRTVLPWE